MSTVDRRAPEVPPVPEPYLYVQRSQGSVLVEGDVMWRSGDWAGRSTPDATPFAQWKVAGDDVTIQTDRNSVYPLFIWSDRVQIAVSPSIPQLLRLGAPHDIDIPAFAAFLRLGFFLGNDTPFAAIRAVPGGRHQVKLGSEFVAPEDNIPPVEASSIARDEALDRFIELFRAAIATGIEGAVQIVLPLSGGRDSRHILLEMFEQGRPPDLCATATYYPPRPDVDLEVARMLAEHLRVPHRTITQTRSQLATIRRHIRETGFCTLTPSSFVQPIADFCRAHGVDCVVDGIAGDTLSAGHFLNRETDKLYSQGRYDELAETLLGTFNGIDEGLIGAMVSSGHVRALDRGLASERVIRELKRHEAAANPVTSFVFFNRTRRDIALMPTRVYRAIPRVVCPYLFPDLFDLLYSLPASMVVNHRFHDAAIRRAYPRAGAFAYARHAPDQHNRRQQVRFATETARLLGRPGRARLISKRFAWPRILRCLVDPAYLPSISWFGPWLVYLAELGSAL